MIQQVAIYARPTGTQPELHREAQDTVTRQRPCSDGSCRGRRYPTDRPTVWRQSGERDQHPPRHDGHLMHILIIVVLLMVAFSMFRRFVGSILAVVFWLAVAATVLAMVGATSN